MTNIDLEIILLIFFWIGAWGCIDLLVKFIFCQVGCQHDPGIKFVIYFVMALMGLCLINYIINVDDDDNNNTNNTNNNNKNPNNKNPNNNNKNTNNDKPKTPC